MCNTHKADETPKAGLVVQVIPGHVHKVISLGQSENVLSQKKKTWRSSEVCVCSHILC